MLDLTFIKLSTLFRNQSMKSLKLTPAFAILFLFSCSTKTQNISSQNDLSSSLDQTNQNINVKNNYSKGLSKMKPTNKNEVQASDFLLYADAENIEILLKENRASFVVFGMVSHDYSDFEKKYGIKVKTENCVITTGISKIAALNNHLISEYLNAKFNNEWKSDLNFVPFGLN